MSIGELSLYLESAVSLSLILQMSLSAHGNIWECIIFPADGYDKSVDRLLSGIRYRNRMLPALYFHHIGCKRHQDQRNDRSYRVI